MLIADSSNPWWVAITVGLISGAFSIVGIIISHMLNVSSEIKSKSRIEWIKEVRKCTSDYMVSLVEYNSFVGDIDNSELKGKPLKESVPIIINNKQVYVNSSTKSSYVNVWLNVINNENKLLMCFSENNIYKRPKFFHLKKFYYAKKMDFIIKKYNNSNDDLVKIANFPYTNYRKNLYIQIFIKNYIKKVMPNKYDSDKYYIILRGLEDYLNNLNDIISTYIKIEWDRAKKGK